MPMIERSSGTRRPEARAALSRTPIAISSEAATMAVGRSRAGEQRAGCRGRRLGGPVGPEDPLLSLAGEPVAAHGVTERLEAVLGGLDVGDVRGTAPM